MTLEIAIIADDLTGALDTSAPFVAAGYTVAAATRPAGLAAALARGTEVVVVNTASRGLAADAAAAIAAQVARQLRTAQPAIVFKKIDSRLKGNVGAETAAVVDALGRSAIVVAPAVPEQQRFVRGGIVVGRGVATPVPVAPSFAGLTATIAEADSDADLDRVVAQYDWSTTLAVGARGLGAAFVRRRAAGSAEPFPADRQTLFVIGSRDPITGEQVAALRGVDVRDAPGGVFSGPLALPGCIRCVGPDGDADAIATHLAASAADVIAHARPKVLVLSGGDTALAVLDQLGVSLVRPRGEAAGGLPWFAVERSSGDAMIVVVKSGGFGDSKSMAALLPAAHKC